MQPSTSVAAQKHDALLCCGAGYYVPDEKRGSVTEDLVKQTKGRSLEDDMLAGPMDGVF